MTDQLNREGLKAVAYALLDRDEAARAPGQNPQLVSFKLRVNDQNPGHTRVTVFAGTREGSRGNTGELTLRTPDEWPAFRARIEGHDALIEALKKIEEGRGRFSRDHLTHCENTVEDMRTIARDAITAATGEQYPDTLRATEEG